MLAGGRLGARMRDAVIGAAVMVVLFGGWRFYAGWCVGRIELVLAEGEPVVAQVLEEDADIAIGEPVDVVTRATISLPQGEYRLRVDGKGRLGRTYRIGVRRGETQSHLISIDEGRLLGGERSAGEMRVRDLSRPIRFAAVTHALELLPGKADLIEWASDSPRLGELARASLIRRDGATGEVIWDAARPRTSIALAGDPRQWMSSFNGRGWGSIALADRARSQWRRHA